MTSTSTAKRWTRSRPIWTRPRKYLKNVTKYAIAHLEALLAKYGPLYPRLTKSSRYDEVDAREVAFKAFKVAYDRESGYVGYKVSGEEFKLDCTKFDKLLLVFRDGHYKVVELPEKLFVGPDLFYCGLPERDRVFTAGLHESRGDFLKRFTFGGTILNKDYFCIPPKSRILFFEPDTPAELFIRYKPAPYQKINQQTCVPSRDRSQRPQDPRPANFHQGSLRHQQQAPARLGSRGANHQTAIHVKVFGLTGGMGMGKSAAVELLKKRGVAVVDTDDLARQVVEPGQPALARVIKRFGRGIVAANGGLRRPELARLVFADPAARKTSRRSCTRPSAILWKAQVAAWREEERPSAVIVIPLLFETGAEADLDATICIACSEITQRERLLAAVGRPTTSNSVSAPSWPSSKKSLAPIM